MTTKRNNELVIFTHTDLDALGCMLGIEFKFPDIQKKYFHTNYGNIVERVQEIEDYMKENGNTHILIADVSFSDNKESLRKLYSLGKCTHIDHHLYPEDFWDEFPDMKVVYDKTKCATLLCHDYFGNAGKSERLDKLVRIIDVYDLWQINEIEFNIAQDLNNYFWTHDIAVLLDKIIQNEFKLPSDFIEVTSNINANCKNDMIKYQEQKLIQRAGDISLCFIKEWFNQVMIKEMDDGQNMVVGLDPYGIIKVRVNQNAPYSVEQLTEFREKLIGNSNVGHHLAFTYKYKGERSFENLMAEAQRLVQLYTEMF